MNELIFLPRLVVKDLSKELIINQGTIQPGDVILKINDKNIYSYQEFNDALLNSKEADLLLLRDNAYVNTQIQLPVAERVIISDVFPDTPAEKAAFQPGDVVVSIDSQEVIAPADVVNITKKGPDQVHVYNVKRGDQSKQLQVQPNENGLIGVGLTTIYPYQNHLITVYGKDQPTSVLKIQDVQYPFWVAPFKAFDESVHLAGLTVQMFGNVVRSFFTRLTIPEGVAGPVGIAQLTYTFVQQGILSVLRFMALLSLSLAIINVLPFPALDGGRLFFILVEVVTGRKVSGKWEAVIHAIGFVMLMALILAVTYSDIIKLF